jgi:multidrug efflux pump subunit AcrB
MSKWDHIKEFGLSSGSVNNKKTVFLITFIIGLFGYFSYNSMPKESFPELVIPEIYVGIPYPGGSPEFIEEKITQTVEKELNSIKNVDEIASTSIEGYASIQVKFDFSVSPEEARRKVQDAVADARAKPGFPVLQFEPTIKELEFSEFPILNINLSGDYSTDQLKAYGELLEDRIEALSEISEVDIRGVQDKVMRIELKKLEADAKRVAFSDIERAISSENVSVPGGEIMVDGKRRSVKITGEFGNAEDIKNIIVKQENGVDVVFMHEVANVYFGDEDTVSFAREFGNTVVMLDVKKRSGQNLLDAVDKIEKIVAERKGIPADVTITLTNDQSEQTRNNVSNLENSIIFGVLLVVGVLLFFLGLRNAMFVGVAIPLSMFMSYALLDTMGVTLNTIVLFSLVLALGMLVDNGIVVVENIYRMMDEYGMDPITASKKGVGEVAWPIISSTATTLAAFVPLAMWPGMMGEFMKYLPITLIIVLGSSLFVALVINPVLTSVYMKLKENEPNRKRLHIITGIVTVLGILLVGAGSIVLGNVFILAGMFILMNLYFFRPGAAWFQNVLLPKLEVRYEKFLKFALRNPGRMTLGTFGLLIFSFVLTGIFTPKVLFFPENEPQYVNIFVEHPIGTDIKVTNKTALKIEAILDSVILTKYEDNYAVRKLTLDNGEHVKDTVRLIKSIISQVGRGTSDPAQGQPDVGNSPHKARITVSFAEFQYRKGIKTSDVMTDIQNALHDKFPADVRVFADKNSAGPPQKPPVNIEVKGPGNYQTNVEYAENIRNYLREKNVNGIEELRLDVPTGKPDLEMLIDRNKAIRYGLSTGQVADAIRTSIFGKDISTYKLSGETYDINMRLEEARRNSLDDIENTVITFRNNMGRLMSVPVKSVLKDNISRTTYGSVVRKDLERVVTVYSNISGDANPNEVVEELKGHLEDYMKTPAGKAMKQAGYSYEFTGQQAEQAKEMAFLSKALLIAVFLILLIIVAQFNAFSTPVIIMFTVLLSLIGVFLGLVIFQMDFVIIMTMIGIISLAGVVVNNAIVLIDYTNQIQKRKRAEQQLTPEQLLSITDIVASIVESGKTRLRPVLLTAITTVLGLIPLATGLNIDFINLIKNYDPNIYVGGDNVMFFGPMSWTIIFGLSFATFLTLIIVPVLYLLMYKFKLFLFKTFKWQMRSNL